MESTVVQTPARSQSRFNRFFVRWLASPLGFLSGKAVLVRYTGRVSGLRRQLPVNVVRFENGYLIRVGKPEEKRWWRNFRSPWPVELIRGPRRIRGSAVVVPGRTDQGRRIAADYFTTHHGAARRAGLPRLYRGEQPTTEALQAAAAGLLFVVVTPEP
jgi:hypothetical protein